MATDCITDRHFTRGVGSKARVTRHRDSLDGVCPGVQTRYMLTCSDRRSLGRSRAGDVTDMTVWPGLRLGLAVNAG